MGVCVSTRCLVGNRGQGPPPATLFRLSPEGTAPLEDVYENRPCRDFSRFRKYITPDG